MQAVASDLWWGLQIIPLRPVGPEDISPTIKNVLLWVDVFVTFPFLSAHTASFLSHDARIASTGTVPLLSETNLKSDKAD